MRKIGLISDIHGNITAVEHVIRDARENGVDEFWFLGDLLMPGPGRGELIELLQKSNTTAFVKGNWDGCFTSVIEEYDTINYEDPEEVYIFKLVKYVMEGMTDEQVQFMFDIPMTVEKEVNGVKFHLSHNLPDKFNGGDLVVHQSAANFTRLFDHTDAKVAIYGHIHEPLIRQVGMGDERKVINPGAISATKGKGSNYAILRVNEDATWSVEFKYIIHKHENELEYARHYELPYFDLYEDTMLNHIYHTHDAEGINANNEKYDYVEKVKTWLADEKTQIIFRKYKE
ncbi:hypothetical protein ERX35_002805 [Macrococcus equipercicus]|uniref:Calcineurin-like phosphoesterase domain-containing protein n=1 Tax=Macrococcus equipercicus TaxID=69967 RepID=A0ABQ6R9H1_9STAP|nr:metallophosphoesterase family protein [Macrococcus equipercicus]KAA1039935.1 hypothetical protein ERX35_002805 [Macrococcus equipercicus]